MKIYQTGWYGRAHQNNQSAISTNVHITIDGKPACGYKPHPTMQFQWCANQIIFGYIECTKCKKSQLIKSLK